MNGLLELLTFITSGFWVFWGSLLFVTSVIASTGWALHAVLLGIRGRQLEESAAP